MVITRMRWKAIHFNNNVSIDNNKEGNTKCYGQKSSYNSRNMKELIPFENETLQTPFRKNLRIH